MIEGEAVVYKRKNDAAVYIRVCAGVATDSAFPFKHLDRLNARITPEGEILIGRKKEKP